VPRDSKEGVFTPAILHPLTHTDAFEVLKKGHLVDVMVLSLTRDKFRVDEILGGEQYGENRPLF
jgi:hypothetical protein